MEQKLKIVVRNYGRKIIWISADTYSLLESISKQSGRTLKEVAELCIDFAYKRIELVEED